jgi:hypothetical protein
MTFFMSMCLLSDILLIAFKYQGEIIKPGGLAVHKNSYFVCFRVTWCDFVDRMAGNPKHTIHEITRNLTKQHEVMLISYALSGPLRTCG